MKILVTNDDGIFSEGLAIVVKWAVKLGDVYVAAPKRQQSGKSHAISINCPFEVEETSLGLGEKAAYAVCSTPVDCVRFATLGLNTAYDLVISGVNNGFNMGEDILYSGTVGAVFEAKLRNCRGMALSTEFTTFRFAEENLDDIYNYFVENKLFEHNLIYNVNIPIEPKGILLTRQGGAYFSDHWVKRNDGLWEQNGFCVHENVHDLTLDTDATIDGFITVTPLSTDRSDVDVWKKIHK